MITIIILIILATVAINFAFGDNGLITEAEKARDIAANSTVEEETAMNSMIAEIDNINGGANAENSLVKAFERGEIKVGDYVNYTPEAHDPITVGTSETGYTNSAGISDGTDQIFSQDASTTWRVLGLSEDGQHLLLTTGSPIKKDGDDPYLVLESYIGADNCVNVLNTISSLYHNSTLADETRSMTIEDIKNAVIDSATEILEESGENVEVDITVQKATSAGNDGNVYLTVNGEEMPIGETSTYPSYTYNNTNFTLTNPPQIAIAGNTIDADLWQISYTSGRNTRAPYITETVYDMLFTGTTENSNYAKAYWLASLGVRAHSDYAAFGPGSVYDGDAFSGGLNLFGSDGIWRAGGFAVRPVVVLKSNITVDQIQVIDDLTEATWSTSGGGQYGDGQYNG